jgi:FkbM family methyltransferase
MLSQSRSRNFIRNTSHRNPYRVITLPLLARIYRYPYLRWSSVHRRMLFGLPWLFAFALLRKLSPIARKGTFELTLPRGLTTLTFDARNAQFQSLYLPHFANGYEPEVLALIDVLLPDDGIFFDIGSNWGYFSIYAGAKPGFRGTIHAFEPFPSTFSDLVGLVKQAGLDDVIKCEACALSDYNGKGEMKLADFIHSGQAALQGKNSQIGGVKVARLDSLELPPPTLIKIDAEGSEASILVGSIEVVRKHRPFIIFESLRDFGTPFRTLHPFTLLERQNYVFFHPAWVRDDNGTSFCVSEGHIAKKKDEPLTLIPMAPAERFLHQDQVNILACPVERLPCLAENIPANSELKPNSPGLISEQTCQLSVPRTD